MRWQRCSIQWDSRHFALSSRDGGLRGVPVRIVRSLRSRGKLGVISTKLLYVFLLFLPAEEIPLRHSSTFLSLAVAAAFVAGIFASPLASRMTASSRAEGAPLTPAMIDLVGIKHGDLPSTSNPEMNSKALVVTDNATIGIQSGNVAKHIHAKTDEIQYIIEGSGEMWLGGERKAFKPGTLIVIPKGTAHGGTLVTSGPVKAIAIKIPPQPKDDVTFVN
jgi:mannose-6-phosphate isomerase-like protein (cupin superfamily)